MMNRTAMLLAVLLVAAAARPASAQPIGVYNQPGNPYAGPPVSPYLNLLNRGNPAILPGKPDLADGFRADLVGGIESGEIVRAPDTLTKVRQQQ